MRSPAALPLAALALAAASAAAQDTYPARAHGDMAAVLTVEVLDGAETPGVARVRYTLTVTGGPRLEVEPPRLADAQGGWGWQAASSWALADGRATWAETFLLQQSRPGVVPLPDLKVRFRDGAGGEWAAEEWAGVQDLYDPPGPAAAPAAPTAGWRHWGWAAAVALAAVALAAVALRRRPRAEPAAAPEEWALREVERLEGAGAGDDPARYGALADVVRRYLAERHGLPALRQTTAEFLASVGGVPQLSADDLALLRDLLGHCDLAKFTGVRPDPDDFRRSAGLARAFLQRPTP